MFQIPQLDQPWREPVHAPARGRRRVGADMPLRGGKSCLPESGRRVGVEQRVECQHDNDNCKIRCWNWYSFHLRMIWGQKPAGRSRVLEDCLESLGGGRPISPLFATMTRVLANTHVVAPDWTHLCPTSGPVPRRSESNPGPTCRDLDDGRRRRRGFGVWG